MMPVETIGAYTLRQSDDCFKLGRDSVLLSQFATLRRGDTVCDLGCGVGTLLLLLSARTADIRRWGVEMDARAAALARENLLENGLDGTILEDDLRRPALLPVSHFKLVISNPPYFEAGSGKSGGPARMEEALTLSELCAVAQRITRTGGRFALSYRPERLPELFAALTAAQFAPKRLRLLAHAPQKPPFAALVEAVRGGKAGLEILPQHYETMDE